MKSRALLDTNILIHREASAVVRDDIGTLFRWLDRLNYEKCVHPESVVEVRKHRDPKVVLTFERKLQSYRQLKTQAADTPGIAALRPDDKTDNDRVDTSMLAEVAADRVDILITEDRRIHDKARSLGSRRACLRSMHSLKRSPLRTRSRRLQNSVGQGAFGQVNLTDPFFDSFGPTTLSSITGSTEGR